MFAEYVRLGGRTKIYDAPRKITYRQTPTGNYIDAEKLTQLFRSNSQNRNRKAIAQSIYLIAHRFAGKLANNTHCEDAASEAAIIGIRKIWHYTKNCRHTNAFGFFTKLVQREIYRQLKMESNLAQGLPRRHRAKPSNEPRTGVSGA